MCPTSKSTSALRFEPLANLDQDTAVMPARHRSWDPVSLARPCRPPGWSVADRRDVLDYGVPYTDDRIAQATFVAALATDPRFDGPAPSC